MREVARIYPPLKWRVFVVDITVIMKGRNKEVAAMAKMVMKKLKEALWR